MLKTFQIFLSLFNFLQPSSPLTHLGSLKVDSAAGEMVSIRKPALWSCIDFITIPSHFSTICKLHPILHNFTYLYYICMSFLLSVHCCLEFIFLLILWCHLKRITLVVNWSFGDLTLFIILILITLKLSLNLYC